MPSRGAENPDAAAFRAELKQRMKRRGLTQAILAGNIAQSPEYLRKILALAQPPAPYVARRIAEELAIPPEEQAAFVRRFRPAAGRPVPPPLPTVRQAVVGADAVVADLVALLTQPHIHLLTVIGPGGVGKTCLALQAARQVQAAYPDGAWFVDLSPVRDPALVAGALAARLQLAESPDPATLTDLTDYVRHRKLLLVLDSFEQVPAAVDLLGALLNSAPDLTLLVTSRTPLHLYGEHLFRVPPLALPPLAAPDLAAVAASPAVQLFVARAQTVQPNFRLTPTTAPLVAAICARLDGVPLLIQLAAERVKHYPDLAAFLAALDAPLDLLTYSRQDVPPRHQALRATLDWSHTLLSAAEQRLFARLAVFDGGCSLAAAEAICGASADDLLRLINVGLVQPVPDSRCEIRYVLPFTTWAYAHERLVATDEQSALQAAHAAYYLEQAQQAAGELGGQESAAAGLAWLEIEHANLWAALARAGAAPAVGGLLAPALAAQAAQQPTLERAAALFAESWHLAYIEAAAGLQADALAGLAAVAAAAGQPVWAAQFAAAGQVLCAVCALPVPAAPLLRAPPADPAEPLRILETALADLERLPASTPVRARAIVLAQQGGMASARAEWGRALHRLQAARTLLHDLDDPVAEAAVAQRITAILAHLHEHPPE